MPKSVTVGEDSGHAREIDLGPLRYQVEKYKSEDVQFVVYKLSYAGKYIYIKGKSLAGSLIILTDTMKSFNNKNSERFKGHLYTHLYNHIGDYPGNRFTIKIIATADDEQSFYNLLKEEQMVLDAARYDTDCLNNQTEAYIPQYNDSTGMYGWLPKSAVMNFKKYLTSQERKDFQSQYKK